MPLHLFSVITFICYSLITKEIRPLPTKYYVFIVTCWCSAQCYKITLIAIPSVPDICYWTRYHWSGSRYKGDVEVIGKWCQDLELTIYWTGHLICYIDALLLLNLLSAFFLILGLVIAPKISFVFNYLMINLNTVNLWSSFTHMWFAVFLSRIWITSLFRWPKPSHRQQPLTDHQDPEILHIVMMSLWLLTAWYCWTRVLYRHRNKNYGNALIYGWYLFIAPVSG